MVSTIGSTDLMDREGGVTRQNNLMDGRLTGQNTLMDGGLTRQNTLMDGGLTRQNKQRLDTIDWGPNGSLCCLCAFLYCSLCYSLCCSLCCFLCCWLAPLQYLVGHSVRTSDCVDIYSRMVSAEGVVIPSRSPQRRTSRRWTAHARID